MSKIEHLMKINVRVNVTVHFLPPIWTTLYVYWGKKEWTVLIMERPCRWIYTHTK